MAADFTIVSGDTAPSFGTTLKFENGEPVPLEGAEVKLVMRSLTSAEPVRLTGTLTLLPGDGEVAFTFSETDTRIPGNYMGNWKVVFPTGAQMTFPTVGYLWIQFQPNLSSEIAAQIVGLPEVLDHLFIPSSDRTHDTTLLQMIQAVQPLIEDEIGPLLPKRYDEWYEGGHSTIALRHQPSYGYGAKPVFMVLAVSEYRGPIEYTLSLVPTPTQGSVYSSMGHGQLGMIVRRTSGGGTYAFWRDPSHPAQSVHVVYYVGQEEVPSNVRFAAKEAIRWWYETTEAVGKGSLAQADSIPLQPMMALPHHVRAMLQPQRLAPSLA